MSAGRAGRITERPLDEPRNDNNIEVRVTPVIGYFDSRLFGRECIGRWLATQFPHATVKSFDSVADMRRSELDTAHYILLVYHIGADSPSTARVARELALLVEQQPSVPLALLGDEEEPVMMAELVGLGVKGYIPTSASAEVAVGVLRLVCAGGTYVPTSVLRSWTRAASEPATALAAWGRLTPREREVVNYLRRGLPNKLIAHELDMCEGTVKVHVRNVMKKLGVCSRAQFALQALGHADAPGPQGSFP